MQVVRYGEGVTEINAINLVPGDIVEVAGARSCSPLSLSLSLFSPSSFYASFLSLLHYK